MQIFIYETWLFFSYKTFFILCLASPRKNFWLRHWVNPALKCMSLKRKTNYNSLLNIINRAVSIRYCPITHKVYTIFFFNNWNPISSYDFSSKSLNQNHNLNQVFSFYLFYFILFYFLLCVWFLQQVVYTNNYLNK